MASPLPLFAIQDLESLRQLPESIIIYSPNMLGCQEQKKTFSTDCCAGAGDTSSCSKGNGMLKILMENGQWKKGGEPRTSTHRFV